MKIFNKTLCITFMSMCFITPNALAMTFSQPIKLGQVSCDEFTGEWNIKGATSINGSKFHGVAKFEKGSNALYCWYDKWSQQFGDASKNRVFSVRCTFSDIDLITNDSNIPKLYLIASYSHSPDIKNYILLGKGIDGLFVKYLDSNEIKRKFFSEPINCTFNRIIVKKDTIVLIYQCYKSNVGVVDAGEFCFKWDDTAQWFGVEQVVY